MTAYMDLFQINSLTLFVIPVLVYGAVWVAAAVFNGRHR